MNYSRITIVIIASIIVVLACEKFAKKETIIPQKWLVDKIEIGDVLLEKDQLKGFYLWVKPDGTYENKGHTTYRGNWRIKQDSLIISNEKTGRESAYYIEKLSNNELIILDNSEGVFQRIFYKPE